MVSVSDKNKMTQYDLNMIKYILTVKIFSINHHKRECKNGYSFFKKYAHGANE